MKVNIFGQCMKRDFGSERQAKKELKKARRAGCVDYYHCNMCGGWHLTSKRKSHYDRRAQNELSAL